MTVAVVVAEFGGGGVVHVIGGPGVGEAAAGDALAQQHIGDDVTAHVAALGDQQNGADAGDGLQRGGVDDAAHVQQDHHLLIVLPQSRQQGDFLLGELVVAGGGKAVAALAGVSCQHIDGQVTLGLLEGGQCLGNKVLIEHHKEEGHAGGLGSFLEACHIGGVFRTGGLILGIQPVLGGDGEAGGLQALLHGDVVTAVDLAAAGAALDGCPGAVAVEGDLGGAGEGQSPVIFQQHHALPGNAADEVAVGLLAGSDVGGGVCAIMNHGWLTPFDV